MNEVFDSTGGEQRLQVVDEGGARPLVVDLDETLIQTDLLIESFFAYLAGR